MKDTLPPITTQSVSGQVINLSRPDPATIRVTDIAESLAKQCRFNGQIDCFYSVAQHSTVVSDLLPRRLALHGLLHDAHEAYTGDITRPIKDMLRHLTGWNPVARIENDIDTAIHAAIGLRWPLPPEDAALIKAADEQALATEKRDLCPRIWGPWPGLPEPADFMIRPAPWPKAMEKFVKKFVTLAFIQCPDALVTQGLDPLTLKEAAL